MKAENAVYLKTVHLLYLQGSEETASGSNAREPPASIEAPGCGSPNPCQQHKESDVAMGLEPPDFRSSKQAESTIETTEQHSVSCQAEPKVRSCSVQWEEPWEAVEMDHAYYAPASQTRSVETQAGTDLGKTL